MPPLEEEGDVHEADEGYLRDYELFARAMAGWTNHPRSFSPGDGYWTDCSDQPKHPMPTTEAGWVEMKGLSK